MANGEAVAKRLKEISHYPADFAKAFPGQKDPVTFDNFANAVAAFERTLISRGRLDRYIDGDARALTDQEKQGTHAQLGPDAKNSKMRFSGNTLNCTSCHLDSGTKQFGIPWMGVSQAYPQYRGREDKEQGLEERINGCFVRSLNGKDLPADSKEMKAMVAYMGWLSKDMPKKVAGLGIPKYEPPTRKADLKNGEHAYDRFCLSCHGKDGNGYQSMSAGSSGSRVVPALCGAGSYNNGAGMNRLLTTAAFIQGNMPLGTVWTHPVISSEDAYDIAGYLSSGKRPQMSGLEKDYPKLEKKPMDAPYPPFADKLPQERHQYGPFQSVKATGKAN